MAGCDRDSRPTWVTGIWHTAAATTTQTAGVKS